MITKVARPIRDELVKTIGTEAVNSEDVLHNIHRFNGTHGDRFKSRSRLQRKCRLEETYDPQEQYEWVIGSMDVKTLFPSITIKLAEDSVKEAINRSSLEF